eukprot:1137870-Pelagomonas_calceolata.AAC.3
MEFAILTYVAAVIVRAGEAGGLSWRSNPLNGNYRSTCSFSPLASATPHKIEALYRACCVSCCMCAYEGRACKGRRRVNLVRAVTDSTLQQFYD